MTRKEFNLSSFLNGESEAEALKRAKATKIYLIDVNEVLENSSNFYSMNEEEINYLSEDIRKNGIWQDLVAYKEEGGYTLLSGHRRLAAIKKLLAEGYSYSFHGQDITGKLPLTIADKPGNSSYMNLALISANQERNLTVTEKETVIQKTLDSLRELADQGQFQWPQAVRTYEVIAQKTGFSGNVVKNYLVKTHQGKNGIIEANLNNEPRNSTNSQYRKIKKSISSLRKNLSNLSEEELTIDVIDDLMYLRNEFESILEELQNRLRSVSERK